MEVGGGRKGRIAPKKTSNSTDVNSHACGEGKHDFESKDEATDGIEHAATSSMTASVLLCLSILRASHPC